MRNIALALILNVPVYATTAVSTDKYIYSYKDNTPVPAIRTEFSTGKVEIYTNLHSKKLSSDDLQAIRTKYYQQMSLKEFKSKTADTKEIQVKLKYHWVDYNEYNRIKQLPQLPSQN